MSKVNTLRQMKQKSVHDENSKETGWNNRFHLSKLPTYNAFSDENCNKII